MSTQSREGRAFVVYLGLGPDRSLAELAAVLRADPSRAGLKRAPSLRTLEGWSVRYRWQDRITDIDRRAREDAERQHLEWVSQHRERLRREGLLLQQRGMEWLKNKDSDEVKAQDAIRAIDTGFRLEALALGEATQRVAVEEDDDRLQRLTDEDLDLIIRHARQVQSGSPPREGEAPSG